jgi:hypothetical protein
MSSELFEILLYIYKKKKKLELLHETRMMMTLEFCEMIDTRNAKTAFR